MTWQYLACLLRNGELYEQLGAWEDALLAFKEGLLMVWTSFGELLLTAGSGASTLRGGPEKQVLYGKPICFLENSMQDRLVYG